MAKDRPWRWNNRELQHDNAFLQKEFSRKTKEMSILKSLEYPRRRLCLAQNLAETISVL